MIYSFCSMLTENQQEKSLLTIEWLEKKIPISVPPLLLLLLRLLQESLFINTGFHSEESICRVSVSVTPPPYAGGTECVGQHYQPPAGGADKPNRPSDRPCAVLCLPTKKKNR